MSWLPHSLRYFQERRLSASSGTGVFLERRIVERCRALAVADVLHAWRHGIIDAQDRKLVAVLDAALGDPVRVWPDEGGPE